MLLYTGKGQRFTGDRVLLARDKGLQGTQCYCQGTEFYRGQSVTGWAHFALYIKIQELKG